jgi:hypothetical protein
VHKKEGEKEGEQERKKDRKKERQTPPMATTKTKQYAIGAPWAGGGKEVKEEAGVGVGGQREECEACRAAGCSEGR